jgi:phosphoribosyl 1,2-cyclic phosphodiesterase
LQPPATGFPPPKRFGFSILGSGSEGNCTYLECGATRVLLDCGFSARETQARLQRHGGDGENLTAILITHEHGDHVQGLQACARRFNAPVWMTRGTHRALNGKLGSDIKVKFFYPHAAFTIQDLFIEPFAVPHDAAEPSQFVFGDGQHRLGYLTDVGSITPRIESTLSGCTALVLECNHDETLLWDGPYAESLKERIASETGHLNNGAAARLLSHVKHAGLRHVVAAHLSQTNNTPALARAALANALNCAPHEVEVADQTAGLEFRSLN